ncbi:hypothetical protein [Micromonospora echinospora]
MLARPGANGSAKSTLLRLLAGAEWPSPRCRSTRTSATRRP